MAAGETPIKVARVIARLNIGGPAIHTILLTEGLAGARFVPVLVTGVVGDAEGDMTFYAQEKKVEPLVIPVLGRDISWRHDLTALWKLVQLFRRMRPDIVHTHTAKAGLLGRLAAFAAGVPIRVHTFHGHVLQGYFGPAKTTLFILIERWLARITHRIIAISPSQRDELSQAYRIAGPKKFQVIPLGFDLEPFVGHEPGGAVRKELGIPHGTFTVGLIGRLVSIKNPMLFIEAIDLVKQSLEKRPDTSSRALGDLVRGIIVGGGDLEDALRQRIHEKGPEELIVFLGWRRDMAAIYADLDMVMLTSDNEGTPVVLIEAMASGKPFIATDVGSVRDLVDGVGRAMVGETGGHFTVYQNGILVSPKDAQGLASALLYAREQGEERARMGRAGRDLAVQRFGKERLLRDMRELYEELLRPTGVERRVA